MVDKIQIRLGDYSIPEPDNSRQQAAVLIPLNLVGKPSLVLTQRASHMNAHGGEVAWPGGKRDLEDNSLCDTALRETEEEIGLDPGQTEIVGQLRPFISKHGLLVTPYIGLIREQVQWRPNPEEIESIFEVPLDFLGPDPRVQTDVISRHGETHHVPVYIYNGYRIWGLTAMILREFLVCALGMSIR